MEQLAELLKRAPPPPEPEVSPRSAVSEYRQTHANLSLAEILHLLKSKVVAGRDIPETLDAPPWRLPLAAHPRAGLVNAVLSESTRAQSSTVPDSGDFEDFVLSNASLAVAGLVRSYLRCLLGADLCKVELGVLLWDPAARNDADDYEGTPYLWLDVAGHPIDNAFVQIPASGANNLEYFYKAKQVSSYVKENPFKTKLKLYLGQEDDLGDTVRHNFRIYRDYANDDNVEKFVVFEIGRAHV